MITSSAPRRGSDSLMPLIAGGGQPGGERARGPALPSVGSVGWPPAPSGLGLGSQGATPRRRDARAAVDRAQGRQRSLLSSFAHRDVS